MLESMVTKLTLQSSDGKFFTVDESVAFFSTVIKQGVSDERKTNDQTSKMIVLIGWKSDVLSKLIEYCEKHSHEDKEVEMDKWDSEFVNGVDREKLGDLIRAANFFCISGLHGLLGKRIASLRAPRRVARRSACTMAMVPPLKKKMKVPLRSPWARVKVAKRCWESAAMVLPLKKRRVYYSEEEEEEEDKEEEEEVGMEESVGDNMLDSDHHLTSFQVEGGDDDDDAESSSSHCY